MPTAMPSAYNIQSQLPQLPAIINDTSHIHQQPSLLTSKTEQQQDTTLFPLTRLPHGLHRLILEHLSRNVQSVSRLSSPLLPYAKYLSELANHTLVMTPFMDHTYPIAVAPYTRHLDLVHLAYCIPRLTHFPILESLKLTVNSKTLTRNPVPETLRNLHIIITENPRPTSLYRQVQTLNLHTLAITCESNRAMCNVLYLAQANDINQFTNVKRLEIYCDHCPDVHGLLCRFPKVTTFLIEAHTLSSICPRSLPRPVKFCLHDYGCNFGYTVHSTATAAANVARLRGEVIEELSIREVCEDPRALLENIRGLKTLDIKLADNTINDLSSCVRGVEDLTVRFSNGAEAEEGKQGDIFALAKSCGPSLKKFRLFGRAAHGDMNAIAEDMGERLHALGWAVVNGEEDDFCELVVTLINFCPNLQKLEGRFHGQQPPALRSLLDRLKMRLPRICFEGIGAWERATSEQWLHGMPDRTTDVWLTSSTDELFDLDSSSESDTNSLDAYEVLNALEVPSETVEHGNHISSVSISQLEAVSSH